MIHRKSRLVLSVTILFVLVASLSGVSGSAVAAPGPANQRYLVVARGAGDYDALRSEAVAAGARILLEMRDTQMFAVSGPAALKSKLATSTHATAVIKDGVRRLINPSGEGFFTPRAGKPVLQRNNATRLNAPVAHTPDPAYSLPGLMWNVEHIGGTSAWSISAGSSQVKVGVADTGLDYTHAELAPKVAAVYDLTTTEDPPLCSTYYGVSDQDLATAYGGPADGDWNGHGSWIGGNIAAALDGMGTNGIAPAVKLVSLKISQWCGSAYDSTILYAFQVAAQQGIDVVSISFGGYLDRSDPDQDTIYKQYVNMVNYALSKGTVIAASAGNDHVRVTKGGKVISHGILTAPGSSTASDYYGLYENPAGIPGVVDVSATGNTVNYTSATCDPGSTGDTDGNAWCKPTSDAHQPFGMGQEDQLAYYSNYGPRIDIAAPGGARKFNLPIWDRGGTPGWPVTTADSYAAWQDFSTTSNWATQIPCYTITGSGWDPNQCYSTIQGTSMATPHVSAVLALAASKYPEMRHDPTALVNWVKSTATPMTSNTTPAISATDLSSGDLISLYPTPCTTGYCHLGGPAIPYLEAFGAGLVNAYNAVGGEH